jgi:hypothetical protein
MLRYMMLLSVFAISACAMTPQQSLALAEAMRSAGEGMSQGAQQMRQRQHELNLQQVPQVPQTVNPTRCETSYDQMTRSYVTQCY